MQLKKITWCDVVLSSAGFADLMTGPGLEVVRIGEMKDLEDYADGNHLAWKSHPNMMFGGYWVDDEANAYIPY